MEIRVLKGDMASMEVPVYALSKNKDVDIWNWVSSNGKKTIKVIPSAEYGRAAVFDKDVVIFAISCLVERYNNVIKPTKVIRFSAYSYFKTTGSGTSSREYKRLEASLKRLATTSIETNISAVKKTSTEIFHILENAKFLIEDAKLIGVEITLSDWLFNAVDGMDVLTLDPAYFELKKPVER